MNMSFRKLICVELCFTLLHLCSTASSVTLQNAFNDNKASNQQTCTTDIMFQDTSENKSAILQTTISEDNETSNSLQNQVTDSTTNDEEDTSITNSFNTLAQRRELEFALSIEWYIKFGGSIVLFILGGLCNILCILILNRPKIAAMPSVFMMRALAFSDLFTILASQSNLFLSSFNITPQLTYPWVCKLWTWAIATFTHFSSYVIAGFSLDRCFAIAIPLKYMSFSYKKQALWGYLIVNFLIAILFESHFLMFFDIGWVHIGHLERLQCYNKHMDKAYFGIPGGPLISFTLSVVIPETVILLCNVIIIIVFTRQRRLSLKMFEGDNKEKRDKENSIIAMLLVVSFAYIALMTPLHVMMVMKTTVNMRNYLSITSETVLFAACLLLAHLNNAINFTLYFISGKLFRAEVKAVLQQIVPVLFKEKKSSPNTSQQPTNSTVT